MNIQLSKSHLIFVKKEKWGKGFFCDGELYCNFMGRIALHFHYSDLQVSLSTLIKT